MKQKFFKRHKPLEVGKIPEPPVGEQGKHIFGPYLEVDRVAQKTIPVSELLTVKEKGIYLAHQNSLFPTAGGDNLSRSNNSEATGQISDSPEPKELDSSATTAFGKSYA